MWAVEDGVHLVFRLGAEWTRESLRSSSGVQLSFGPVTTMPAFVKAVPEGGGAKCDGVMAEETPSFGGV